MILSPGVDTDRKAGEVSQKTLLRSEVDNDEDDNKVFVTKTMMMTMMTMTTR